MSLSLLVVLSAILTVLGDIHVQRPTQGHQLGFGPGSGSDIIFPVTVTQCEPVVIFYNSTDRGFLPLFVDSDNAYDILYLYFPAGVGYLDWICNIPAGYSFDVEYQYYTVQPGSSSACLGDLTITYSYAHYFTTLFQSYTQHSPSANPTLAIQDQLPTIDFPTSAFPTITVNPIATFAASSPLPVTPTTTTRSAASPPLSSPTSSSSVSSHKSVIAGGVVGGIAFVLLLITIIFVIRWKRRNSFSNSPTPYLTSQLGPNSSRADSVNAIRRTAAPDMHVHNHVPTHKSRNRGADLVSALDVTRLTVGQRQALLAALNASANPAAAAPPPVPADAIQTPLEPSVLEAAQEEFPEIANILAVVSQLSPETRIALVASLINLLTVVQAVPADLMRENTPSESLPPYAE